MTIPKSIIENFIKSNFSEAVLTSSDQWKFNSPFVSDGKKRLFISKDTGEWFDQKQQIGGHFLKFVSNYLGMDEEEALKKIISDYSFGNKKELKEVIEKSSNLELPEGLYFFFENQEGIIFNKAKKYLIDRKIKDISSLGFISKSGSEYNNRIFIPFTENNKIVYFITRAFDNNKIRYVNPKGLNAADFVFNFDKIEDECIIFEGVFDAMSLDDQIGSAVLNNKINKNKVIKILDKDPKRIIWVPDADDKKETRELIEKNLIFNIEQFINYKMPSQSIEQLIYRLPEGYKDFNALKVKTGKSFIDKSECEVYKKRKSFNFSFFGKPIIY